MAITSCKECGGKLSSSAKACPHCGAKINKKVGLVGWLVILMIVLPAGWGIGKAIKTTEDAHIYATEQGPASGSDQEAGWSPSKEECLDFSKFANQVMRSRQAGRPMSSIQTGDNALLDSIVLGAYEQTRYSSEEMINRAVADYENAIYVSCINQSK